MAGAFGLELLLSDTVNLWRSPGEYFAPHVRARARTAFGTEILMVRSTLLRRQKPKTDTLTSNYGKSLVSLKNSTVFWLIL